MENLNAEDIRKILPHREPMLMLDSVSSLIPGSSATAEKFIDPGWDVLRGHFPGAPVVPGVLTVEAMAQTAGLVLLSMPEHSGRLPVFAGISRMRFMRPVQPGSTLVLHAEIAPGGQAGTGGVFEFSVSASVGGRRAASGAISIAVR